MEALTKAEALELAKSRRFPEFVIAAFNDLLTDMVLKGESRITQEAAIKKIMNYNPAVHREEIFSNHWLDVEDFYRQAGWTVTFYKPAYNEFSTPAHYTFK